MDEKNISQKFISGNIDERKIYFIKIRNQNDLMSKKDKIVCTSLHYIEHFLRLLDVFKFLILLV